MNLYDLSGSGPDAEKFDQLLSAQRVKIERIVSHGQSTPIDEWYDQGWDEWVIVVAGSAGLLIEGETEVKTLLAGDSLFLPAGCRHRVEWTQEGAPTIWLAVHIYEQQGGPDEHSEEA